MDDGYCLVALSLSPCASMGSLVNQLDLSIFLRPDSLGPCCVLRSRTELPHDNSMYQLQLFVSILAQVYMMLTECGILPAAVTHTTTQKPQAVYEARGQRLFQDPNVDPNAPTNPPQDVGSDHAAMGDAVANGPKTSAAPKDSPPAVA